MKIIFFTILLTSSLFLTLAKSSNEILIQDVDNDMWKSMDQIASENGWATESYNITTADGYILELWRIPGKLGEKYTSKPPVFLMHGLEVDMMCWVYNIPSKSNAFILASQGYDVWMGNNRGCKYGLNHVNLTVHDEEFWRFDQEQMGIYDVPAFIEFIQQKTGVKQISYIGHSQGTTQYFCGNALIPDWYKENINLAIMLAPVAKLYNNNNKKLELVCNNLILEVMKDVINGFDLWYVLGPNKQLQDFELEICEKLGEQECIQLIGVDIEGKDPSIVNLDRIKTVFTMHPSGAGWQTLFHYAQLFKVDKFARFDFGLAKNLMVYGQFTPPDFDMSNINTPIALLSGSLDTLADPLDVQWIKETIPDQIIFEQEYKLNHQAFVIGKNMTWFSEDVVFLLDQYNKN